MNMKNKRLVTLVLSVALGSVSLQAQPVSHSKDIKKIAIRAQELWQVPAMAVTVVKDGETIFAEGIGKLSIEKNAPKANEYTLFVLSLIHI